MAHHREVGDALVAAAKSEWAAVCWFYSAYHLIKANILNDPVWHDLTALHGLHHDLNQDDRFVDRHKGRRRRGQAAEWGVNDLVQLLYPAASGPYERLHQASIKVRYSTGLPSTALTALPADLDKLYEMDKAGGLRVAAPRKPRGWAI